MSLPAFKITLSDGSSYITSLAQGTSLTEAKAYFLGQSFTQADEVTQLQAIAVQPVPTSPP